MKILDRDDRIITLLDNYESDGENTQIPVRMMGRLTKLTNSFLPGGEQPHQGEVYLL